MWPQQRWLTLLAAVLVVLPAQGLTDELEAEVGGSKQQCNEDRQLEEFLDMLPCGGRDVRLAFSDGSKEVLAGRRVSISEALQSLDSYVGRLRSAGAPRRQPSGPAWQGPGSGDADAAGGSDGGDGGGPQQDGRKRQRHDCGAAAGDPMDLEREAHREDELAATDAKRARKEGDDDFGSGKGDCDAGGGGDGGAVPCRALPSAALFGSDNRCCPPGTLHRISRLVHPYDGSVYGLTYRVGRHLPGLAGAVQDVLTDLAGRARAAREAGYEAGAPCAPHDLAGSLLLLGRPGSGKTTLLRDIARFLADDLGLGVVVVDTSNEIAGGDVLPHGCIGGARRILVGERGSLARVMLEAVQNHGPEVVLVDEIANKQEVDAARTISSRGVMLVATCHGTELGSLVRNAELNALVGGLQPVVLGDAAARRSNGGAKARNERSGAPTFRTLVEVLGGGRLRLRPDVAASVDLLLGKESPEARAIKALLNPNSLQAPPGAEEEDPEGVQEAGR
ncbi:hypothetical protein GPECTOR_81g202 [Gonium pectorale]|uniref:AAA+ ATPase domain-containing protein n=1 Tax=Gonium pectorale TaxID=33097 RepID=A0A150G1K6_GONPE|nr:hypothetical protein GPECTOR_81g202 [Gonium pectorale]|eukprot:KXZ43752.1 hypothetical protein GPECTOR_81g202 [Gonium pectorale]